MLIARLTAQLRCYIPEPVDETWGRLRHLGTRRDQLIVTMTSQVQQTRSLMECVWPVALDTAEQPFRSRTRLAALTVVCDRDGGDLDRTRRLGRSGSNGPYGARSPDEVGSSPRCGSPAACSPP